MKRSIIIIGLIVLTLPCAAQWRNVGLGGLGGNTGATFLAFGVHDTNLFVSITYQGAPPDVFLYVPANNSWVHRDSGIDFTQGNVTSFASLGKYFFAGMTKSSGSPGTSWRSSNEGEQWSASASGNVCSAGSYAFCAPGSVFRSSDSGAYNPWEEVSSFNASNLVADGTCIFASNSNSLWRSEDTGNHWSQLSPPFVGTITAMGTLIFIPGNGKLAISTDSGSQWTTVAVDSAGVPENVNCLATDGRNLFAGTPIGVLVSTDTGASWTDVSDGLATYRELYNGRNVVAMTIFDTMLFIGINEGLGLGYGAGRPISEMTKDTTSGVAETPQPGDSLTVYPNPLTNTATIEYWVAEDVRVNITIYDALGRTVSNPVPGLEEGAGQHVLSFDAQPLPSGVYWCHFTAGSTERSVKLVIQH